MTPPPPSTHPRTRSSRPRCRFISVFGLGRLRPAPGTWGSLPPALLAALLWAFDAPAWLLPVALTALLLAASLACLIEGDDAEALAGGKDPGLAVADEVAGMALTLLIVLPWHAPGPWETLLAFLAFRLTDITKPWPADRLQRVPGGLGILLDDLVAGLYAAALTVVALAALAAPAALP